MFTFTSFTVVMVGESGVGKSSLTIRFVSNHFKEHGQPTIGASFLSKTLALQTGGAIKFNIWDTAGQEKYRSLASLYYRGVDIAIIVYDITNRVRNHFSVLPYHFRIHVYQSRIFCGLRLSVLCHLFLLLHSLLSSHLPFCRILLSKCRTIGFRNCSINVSAPEVCRYAAGTIYINHYNHYPLKNGIISHCSSALACC